MVGRGRRFLNFVFLILSVSISLKAEFFEPLSYSSISMQGFTGLINTPNAQVLDEGELVFSWNNQFDNHLRRYNKNRSITDVDDYIFGVGILPNIEIQGRLKEQKGYARDLSANIKVKLPKYFDWMPDIAIGAQDVGSAANLYENYYFVLDKSFGALRASLGYGHSRSSRGVRMDGLFGGAELQILPTLSILGEYDGKESHIGVRVQSEKLLFDSIKLGGLLAMNLSDDNRVSFQLSATFYPDKFSSNNSLKSKTPPISQLNSYDELLKVLEKEGLKDIIIYRDKKSNTITIEYENSIYQNNSFDAISTIIAYSLKLKSGDKRLILHRKKSGVIIDALSLSLDKLSKWITNPSIETKMALEESIYDEDFNIAGEIVACGDESERFRTHIELTPILDTMVGTEVGVFDYQLLLGATAKINLFKGLDFTARYDFHINHSDNFDPDKLGVFSYLYNKGGLNSSMLHYTTNFKGLLNTISAGLYQYEFVGVADQLSYLYNDRHLFGLKFGYFEHIGDYKHPDWQSDKTFYLAKYTYLYEPLDLQLSIQGGKYWHKDEGFDLEMKRFFGNIAVSIKYSQTSPENRKKSLSWAEDSNKYIGLYLEMPLGFDKSKVATKHLQVDMDRSWKQGLRSTIARADGTNTIVPSSAKEPDFDINHYKYLNNRNRIGKKYLKKRLISY